MTLDDLTSWISDDLRYRDLSTDDYTTIGKMLVDIVLALPPRPYGLTEVIHPSQGCGEGSIPSGATMYTKELLEYHEKNHVGAGFSEFCIICIRQKKSGATHPE